MLRWCSDAPRMIVAHFCFVNGNGHCVRSDQGSAATGFPYAKAGQISSKRF